MEKHVSTYILFIVAMFDAMYINFFVVIFNDLKVKLSKVILNGLILGIINFMLYLMQYKFTGIFYIFYISLIFPITITIAIKYIYNIQLSKSLLTAYIISVMEVIFACFIFFSFSAINIEFIDSNKNIILSNIVLYVIKTILILVIRIYKSRINISLSIHSKNLTFIITFILLNIIFIMISAAAIIFYYKNGLNLKLMLFVLIIYVLYFGFNIILTISLTNFDKKSLEIEHQNFYNSTMSEIVKDLKVMKRRYDNTLAALRGYIEFQDWDGMDEYINEIFMKDKSENIRSNLMLQRIKSAGLAGLIMTKFEIMNQSGINAKLNVDDEINEINMNISDLCQSLGILLDNAWEAALNSEEKYVRLSISNKDGIIKFIIENSSDKKTDIEKMFHKVGIIKGEEKGLGFLLLQNTLKKYKNVLINTIQEKNSIKMELTIS